MRMRETDSVLTYRGMAKGIDLPPNLGDGAKLLHQEAVAQGGLVDHRDVVRRGLVVHAPAAVDKLEAVLRDEHANGRLHLLVLLAPPSLEEPLFDVDKAAVRVRHKLRDHRIEDVLDARVLDAVVEAHQVLVNGFQPTNVVVRVAIDVNIENVGVVDALAVTRVVDA